MAPGDAAGIDTLPRGMLCCVEPDRKIRVLLAGDTPPAKDVDPIVDPDERTTSRLQHGLDHGRPSNRD